MEAGVEIATLEPGIGSGSGLGLEPPAPPEPTEYPPSTSLMTHDGEIKELEDIEAEMIRFAIEFYNGKLSEVARRLGMGRSTLYRRLKELGIDNDNQPENDSQKQSA